MNIDDIRTKVRNLVYGFFAILIIIVLIRIFFTLIDANASAPVTRFWFNVISKPLVAPFQDIYPQWLLNTIRIEYSALLAVVVLFLSSLIFAKLATFFLENKIYKVFVNLIDLLFKVIEFVLIFRFIFVLSAAKFVNFGSFIHSLSAPFYEPFKSILPTIPIGSGGHAIELSIVIALVLFIIFDIVTESIFKSLFEKDNATENYQTTQTYTNYSNPTNYQPSYPVDQFQPINQPTPIQPNITINVSNPNQVQPTQERRVVRTVTSTNQPQQNQFDPYRINSPEGS